jgi:RNA polymerase sigma-70 factor (ECF subfamily)
MTHTFESALQTCYENNRQGLFTCALAITRDMTSAEDAVQTAVLGVLRRRRPPRELRPYLYRAVHNAACDFRRRHGGTEGIFVEEEAPAADPADTRLLNQCLGELPEEQRETVVLKAVVGLTFAEIADVHRKSINTVTSRYRRGIEKMRSLLGERHD